MAETQSAQPVRAERAGALAWLVQPLYLVFECVTAVVVTAAYSFVDNTISDLGATTCTTIAYRFGDVPVCSPWHALLNSALVVSGMLIVVGAVLTRHYLPRGAARTLSVWMWVVSGLSSVGTGLVPLDRDLELHSLVSLPSLVAMPLALMATGLALRRLDKPAAAVSIGVGVVGLVAAVAFVVRAGEPGLGGLLERLALWPAYLWLAFAAVRILCGRCARLVGQREGPTPSAQTPQSRSNGRGLRRGDG